MWVGRFLLPYFADNPVMYGWRDLVCQKDMTSGLTLKRGGSLSEMQEEFRREQAAADDQWRRELAGQEDEGEFDDLRPMVGITINGQAVFENVKTGELVTQDGKPVNSCDALRIIDGVQPLPEDEDFDL